jgi:hypothetical protein
LTVWRKIKVLDSSHVVEYPHPHAHPHGGFSRTIVSGKLSMSRF